MLISTLEMEVRMHFLARWSEQIYAVTRKQPTFFIPG
jgi:hypothetical protein